MYVKCLDGAFSESGTVRRPRCVTVCVRAWKVGWRTAVFLAGMLTLNISTRSSVQDCKQCTRTFNNSLLPFVLVVLTVTAC